MHMYTLAYDEVIALGPIYTGSIHGPVSHTYIHTYIHTYTHTHNRSMYANAHVYPRI